MSRYKLMMCSNQRYGRLIAEIYVADKLVAWVTDEDPAQDFCVEFPGPELVEAVVGRKVEFSTLLAALIEARHELARRR